MNMPDQRSDWATGGLLVTIDFGLAVNFNSAFSNAIALAGR